MTENPALKTTPLHAFHLSLSARMVPFAGYDMPVQYPMGVLKEHLHTRQSAGLFDVSHMGQVMIRPKSGKIEDAALALEAIVPVDILGLKLGRQRYGLFTTPEGTLLDDLMITNRGDHLFLVVNAGCKDNDFTHMITHLSSTCDVSMIKDRALIALQGPKAEAALARLNPEVASMTFMDVRDVELVGAPCIVSRSGYSGEDGYEISVPSNMAETLCRALLEDEAVAPIGLGARDSLRLEAGLCLYGNDIDTSITPVEASIEWAIQKARRTGGARQGGFPGADIILAQLQNGAQRRRVGLRPDGKAPVRGGAALFADDQGAMPIGTVTSGGFGPTVDGPVAFGLVSTEYSGLGTQMFAEVRGKYLPVKVSALPFVTPGYKR